jgi:replicative DNA helicase
MSPRSGPVPPHNLHAEASALGAALLSTDALDALIASGIGPEEFYKPTHQSIYAAMRDLARQGVKPDVVTLADELERTGMLDRVGGTEALRALQNATPGVSNVGRYAAMVRATSLRRQSIGFLSELTTSFYDQTIDIGTAVARTIDQLGAVGAVVGAAGHSSAGLAVTNLGHVQPERVVWIWDGRLAIGKLTPLDGLPDMGKSTIALDIAARITTGRPMPDGPNGLDGPADVILFSVEDGLADTVAPRMEAPSTDSSERSHSIITQRCFCSRGGKQPGSGRGRAGSAGFAAAHRPAGEPEPPDYEKVILQVPSELIVVTAGPACTGTLPL